MAADKCARLLGQFRRNDADDPETFVVALTAIMTQYPVPVLDAICSPTEGLATKGSFVPSLFEIREACNETMRLMIAKWKWNSLPPERRAQIENIGKQARENRALSSPEDTPERRRAFLDGLKAKHGDHYGLGGLDDTKPKGEPFKMKSLGEMSEHYRTHGLAFKKKPYSAQEKNHERIVIDAVSEGAHGEGQDQGRADAQEGVEAAPRGTRGDQGEE